MNRRAFFPIVTSGISGSFLVGTLGGVTTGAAGAVVGIDALRPWSRTSYSQQGEDLIVDSICGSLEIRNPTYLDIGAADPIQLNNTYLFYERGCRGVLVEPNPAFCRKLEAQRPKDKVLNVGVGFEDRDSADYYIVGGPHGDYLNTFSPTDVETLRQKAKDLHPIVKVIKMPLVNVNKIMEEQFHGRRISSARIPKVSTSTSSSPSTSTGSARRSSASRRSSSAPNGWRRRSST